MLVLSRSKNERIMIGDDIIITAVEIRGDKCRIGISAPGNIPVHREEVYDAIHRAEQETILKVPPPVDGEEPESKV